MTRKSRRELERLLDDLETTAGTEDLPELTDAEREQIEQVYADAREEMTSEERDRLELLEADLAAEDSPSDELSATEKAYLDLLFGPTAE